MPRAWRPPLLLAAVALTFAAGAVLERGLDVELGTPLPPLLFKVDAEVLAGPLWPLLAALALAGAVAVAPRLLAPRVSPLAFAAATFGLAIVLRLAVGAVRYGPEGWDDPYRESFEAKNEYHFGFPALRDGAGWFLDRFAELVPALPVHVAGHPPGFLLSLEALALRDPGEIVGFITVTGALAVPLAYLLARRLLATEERARIAGLLALLACGTTLYGVSAADATYAALGTGAALALVAAPRVLGPFALAVASFFSYALLAIGAWAVVVRARTDGVRAALVLAAACAAALAGAYALLWALTGFELPEALGRTAEVYENSVARDRPYAYWVFGSPAAWLAFMGLPLAWLLARARPAAQPAALALLLVVAVSALGGFTKAETERIWLMYVPLACVVAAAVLPRRWLLPVLALLAAQTLAVELLFGTVW